MEEHPQARFIVDTLSKAGFIAYYAGGWVRDLLLNHPSDDIDIATNAPPETIQALFPHTVPVGIAFGIVIVIIDGHQYEVATFRQDFDYKDGRRPSRVEFTTAVEDAKRRDFTINGMFYDPIREEILDYVHGRADLEAKIIRAIGNPHERIKEDRLRMIRAIRLACRFGFHIEEGTEKAIRDHVTELFPAVAIERVWQEFTKGHDFGKLRPMLIQLHAFGLLGAIFPSLQGIPVQEIENRLLPIKDYPAKAPVIASILALFPKSSLKEELDLCKKLKLSNHDQQFVTFLFHAKELVHLRGRSKITFSVSEGKFHSSLDDFSLQRSTCISAAEKPSRPERLSSSQTLKLISERSLNRPVELVEWAYFYANAFAPVSLQIIAAHLDPRRQTAFLHEHEEQMEMLQKSIQRIHKHDPVVKSDDLIKAGIKPGVTMGLLLKEADRIAINEQLHEPAPIIERLKNSILWPK